MKQIFILLFITFSLNSFANEMWGKIGQNYDSDFSIDNDSNDYHLKNSFTGSIEYISTFSKFINLGFEVGADSKKYNSKSYEDSLTIGTNIHFNIFPSLSEDSDTGLFFIGLGYNIPYSNETYNSEYIQKIKTKSFFSFGFNFVFGLWAVEFSGKSMDTEFQTSSGTKEGFTDLETIKFCYKFF